MVTRRKPGVVRDAITHYLGNIKGDASVDEIHVAVSAALAGEVARSSVRSYLNLNTPETFLRTAHGRYRLVRR
jgi:site-specific DNA-methyltransferase (adenine-specific)